MWVVKLGGSLWNSSYLKDWLRCLDALSQPVLLVPGGGPFADQVRNAQALWGFDDHSAHRMALLAMEQMAHMICALQPRFRAVADPVKITAAIDDGQVPVWLPCRTVLTDPAVAADWSVTSDSLAVWLASQLDASGVVLVKSAELPAAGTNIVELQREGILDAAFQGYARRFERPIWLMHRADSNALASILNGRGEPGSAIAC